MIDGINDFPCLVECKDGTDGEAEFLPVYLLGDGQREVVIFLIALLLMRGYRIVYQGLDAVLRQVCLQLVTPFAEDGEEVIDVLSIGQARRQGDERVLDMVVVVVGYLLTMGVVLVQMAQLDIQDSCMEFVQTAVATDILEHILTGGAIVGKGTDGVCQLFVVGGHGTAIAKGSEVLARIEAMTGSGAQRAGSSLG